MPLRVLIADDHPCVRDSFRRLLCTLPDVLVVAEASDGQAAYELTLLHRPDVVLMDISMPELDGFEATRRIRLHAPGVHVVVVTAEPTAEYVETSMGAGAVGFVAKSAAETEIPEALQAVARGDGFISSIAELRR